MRFVSCDIETVCLGRAASAAAVLLAAGAPGKRPALPGARVMIHQPSLAEPVQGRARDLEMQAAEMLRTRERLEEMPAEHTGQPLERVRRGIERDAFLDAEGAAAYGLVDRLTADRGRTRAVRAPR